MEDFFWRTLAGLTKLVVQEAFQALALQVGSTRALRVGSATLALEQQMTGRV